MRKVNFDRITLTEWWGRDLHVRPELLHEELFTISSVSRLVGSMNIQDTDIRFSVMGNHQLIAMAIALKEARSILVYTAYTDDGATCIDVHLDGKALSGSVTLLLSVLLGATVKPCGLVLSYESLEPKTILNRFNGIYTRYFSGHTPKVIVINKHKLRGDYIPLVQGA